MAKRTHNNLDWEWVTDNLLQLQQTLNLNSQGCCHMVPNHFQASDVMCVAFLGKTSNFPNLKAYTSQQQFLRLLMTCACARRARLVGSLANWDFLTLFAHHALVISKTYKQSNQIILYYSSIYKAYKFKFSFDTWAQDGTFKIKINIK